MSKMQLLPTNASRIAREVRLLLLALRLAITGLVLAPSRGSG